MGVLRAEGVGRGRYEAKGGRGQGELFSGRTSPPAAASAAAALLRLLDLTPQLRAASAAAALRGLVLTPPNFRRISISPLSKRAWRGGCPTGGRAGGEAARQNLTPHL